MSQSHRIKDWNTGEAFQEQCFLWGRGASVGVYFDHFNFQDLLHAQGTLYEIIFFLQILLGMKAYLT